MSYPTPDNPHNVRKPSHTLVYWEDGKASGPVGADRVEVYQDVHGKGRYSVQAFNLPADTHQLELLEGALERAFEFGRRDKAREMREVLEV